MKPEEQYFRVGFLLLQEEEFILVGLSFLHLDFIFDEQVIAFGKFAGGVAGAQRCAQDQAKAEKDLSQIVENLQFTKIVINEYESRTNLRI